LLPYGTAEQSNRAAKQPSSIKQITRQQKINLKKTRTKRLNLKVNLQIDPTIPQKNNKRQQRK